MDEKIVIVFFISIFVFSSCCTKRGLYYNDAGISKVRDNLNQLGEAETETAIRSEKLESEINQSLEGFRGSIDDINRLEDTIEEGEGDIDEFKNILRRIREGSSKRNQQNNSRKSFISIKNRKAKEAYFGTHRNTYFSYSVDCRIHNLKN